MSDTIKAALLSGMFGLLVATFGILPTMIEKTRTRPRFMKDLNIIDIYEDISFAKKTIAKEMINATEILHISATAHYFVNQYSDLLKKAYKEGKYIKILLCGNQNSLREISTLIYNDKDRSIGHVETTISILKTMMQEKSRADGSIEIRQCQTEIRNTVTIIKKSDNQHKVFVSVVVPTKSSSTCHTIEYSSSEEWLNAFTKLWDKYEDDRIDL